MHASTDDGNLCTSGWVSEGYYWQGQTSFIPLSNLPYGHFLYNLILQAHWPKYACTACRKASSCYILHTLPSPHMQLESIVTMDTVTVYFILHNNYLVRSVKNTTNTYKIISFELRSQTECSQNNNMQPNTPYFVSIPNEGLEQFTHTSQTSTH